MTYENLKAIVDEKRNSEEKCFSALDLYTLATSNLTLIHNVHSYDWFISSRNYRDGYGGRSLKRISKIDGKASPFIAGVQYYTGQREEDNKMIFLLISSENNFDRKTLLEVYTKDNELTYKLHFDDLHDEKKDSHIIKYSKVFLKSFKKELSERLDAIKTIKDTCGVTLNGYDIHAADKYQVLNDGVFKVTFSATANETDLNVEIGFNDEELNNVKDTQYLTRQTLDSYIKQNKTEILSKIKVDETELNSFYKSIISKVPNKSSGIRLNLHK